MKLIHLWSSPRNVSTAFMYSFAQRTDTLVIDEPLYAHYLSKSQVQHPGQDEILASQQQDGNLVMEDIMAIDSAEVIFCKQMTHHLINMNRDFLSESLNLLFIRDPKAIINSYNKVIPNPSMEDIGIKMQAELLQELIEKKAAYWVIDSADLLKNTPAFLRKLCNKLDIPFDQNMLSWKAGPRKEDGIWAKYWYANVHQSTQLEPFKEKDITLSSSNEKLYQDCLPYYEQLIKHKLI